jgi:predicted phosphodiesterase
MKIAILSDIHAAADAYESALHAARAEGFDQLLILGDLLTYGPYPERTLDLTADAVSRDGALLVIGNHDLLYQEPEASSKVYSAGLPEWIRESIDWTCSRMAPDPLSHFKWRDEWSEGELLAAHANPFGVGDWTYLRDNSDFDRASAVLAERGYRYGLFGHIHRFARRNIGRNWVATIGSVGQPRDRQDPLPQWAVARYEGHGWQVEQRHVDFDWSGHRAAIQATSMSSATKQRLCAFFA